MQSPDPATLRIGALPAADDPAAAGFPAGAGIGLIGLDFTTRRRNRANGRLTAVDDGLTVRIAQSFGNCAQYIQTRRPRRVPCAPMPIESLARPRRRGAGGDRLVRHLLRRQPLAARGRRPGRARHVASRRAPGFVGVQDDTLAIPDFRGNRFYNTWATFWATRAPA